MIDRLTIKIPFELASFAVSQRQKKTVYDTNQVIKALGTWLVLKAEAPGGLIQDWNQQKKFLFFLCKCSEAIFRHRLQILKSMKLVSHCQKNLLLTSWDKANDILGIDCTKKYTIQYDLHNKQKVDQWIIATDIKHNQSRQAYMIFKKLTKIPGAKEIIDRQLLKHGADVARLDDADYYLSMMRALYIDDFIQVTDSHNEIINVRPFTDRGVRTMAAAWTAKHPTTISYWKKILQQAGIADITKWKIESTTRTRNEFCHVKWMDTKKMRKLCPALVQQQTILYMADTIFIMEPWQIQNLMAA